MIMEFISSFSNLDEIKFYDYYRVIVVHDSFIYDGEMQFSDSRIGVGVHEIIFGEKVKV